MKPKRNRLGLAETQIAYAQTEGWRTKVALKEATSLLNEVLGEHGSEHFKLGIPFSCHQIPSFLRKNPDLPKPLAAALLHLSNLTAQAKSIPFAEKSTERTIPTLKDVHGNSPKAAETFESMKTNPKDWHKARMKECYLIEEREVFVRCPVCDGNGFSDYYTKAKCSGGCELSMPGSKFWRKRGQSRNEPSRTVWHKVSVPSKTYQSFVVKQKVLCEYEWRAGLARHAYLRKPVCAPTRIHHRRPPVRTVREGDPFRLVRRG